MKYFVPPFTKEHIETQYKELCKILHPDKKGGSEEHFQAMSAEKEIALRIGATQKKPGVKLKMIRSRNLKRKRVPSKQINILLDPESFFKAIKKYFPK